MKNILGIIFCAIVLWSCNSSTNNETATETLPFSFEQEINKLSTTQPAVLKSIGDSDIVKTSTINWESELSFFQLFEKSYSKNKLEYERNEFVVNDNNTREYEYNVIEYTTKKPNLSIHKATYQLVNNKCVKIIFSKKKDNPLVISNQELIYEPTIGYSVSGFKEIHGIDELEYRIKASFIQPNLWRATLSIENDVIPFNFSLENNNMVIYNAEERLPVSNVITKGDSIFITLAYFDSEIRAKITDNEINGYWYNYAKNNYSIPFHAIKSNDRFDYNADANSINISGKWEVNFSPETENEYPAIGLFNQDGNYLTGTFITETGDYRFLEGYIEGKQLKLSCFDGAHAFLFTASVNDEGGLEGQFHSGKHWTEPWIAKRNADAKIQNPYQLTQLITTDSVINLSFPNLDSAIVSLTDETYKNKPVLVQIMGSWCPNCMDESQLLVDLHKKYNPQGLEIVALCFEPSTDFNKNRLKVQKIKENIGIPYEMLLAGKASKKEAGNAFPMLNQIMSFPTTLYLDKDHKVQRIHTGFYGPGTGPYYDSFVTETCAFIETLIK